MAESVDTTSAAKENLSLFLRVEVHEDIACNHILAEVLCASKTSLLVDGKQSLKRTVNESLVGEGSKRSRYADTVVGTESSLVVLRVEPLASHLSEDRVGVEVVGLRLGLVRHHVHVALKHNCRGILFAWSGRDAHSNVADRVGLGFYIVSFGELKQELADFSLLLGRAGNLSDFIEDAKNDFWLEIIDGHSCLQFKIKHLYS